MKREILFSSPDGGLGQRLPTNKTMRQRRALRHSLWGALFCGTSAIVAAYMFRDYSLSLYLPIGFIAIFLTATILWGRGAGMVGSIVSTIAFAVFLFAPFGSLSVSSAVARENLVYMLLAGLVVSYFAGSIGPPHWPS